MSKRVVFEDVGDKPARQAAVERTPKREPARKMIALWLWLLAAMVAAIVLIGGMTRLTDSGLSITQWDPIMGVIPPLSDADWQSAFAAYQKTTEFQEQNHWMTLADFKPLFWWEWGHRLLGRAVGLVWALGFLGFALSRAIPRHWGPRLLLPGLLGGLQGAIGWWMVSSGLVNRLDVAPYRLAIHLGLAITIFALLMWLARRIRLDEVASLQARRRRNPAMLRWCKVLGGLIFIQILLGALVAGLDAGRGYVDWPFMQGQFFPDDATAMAPLWINFFENPAMTQFCHRMVGYLVLATAILFLLKARGSGQKAIRARAHGLVGMIFLQVVFGIVTLVHAAPLMLAIIHQALALGIIVLWVRARFTMAYPPEQHIRDQ